MIYLSGPLLIDFLVKSKILPLKIILQWVYNHHGVAALETAPKSGSNRHFPSSAQKIAPPRVFFANRIDLVLGPPPLLMSQNEVVIGIGQLQGLILISSHWFVAGHPTQFCPMGNSRKQMGPWKDKGLRDILLSHLELCSLHKATRGLSPRMRQWSWGWQRGRWKPPGSLIPWWTARLTSPTTSFLRASCKVK